MLAVLLQFLLAQIIFLLRSPSPTRPTGPKKCAPYTRNRLSYNSDEIDERSPNNDSSGKTINMLHRAAQLKYPVSVILF